MLLLGGEDERDKVASEDKAALCRDDGLDARFVMRFRLKQVTAHKVGKKNYRLWRS
jgi:hypothetical protein